MNIPKKINNAIKGDIISYFASHYNLTPSKGMDYLAGRIVKDFQTMITAKQYYGKSNLGKLAALWFKTSNIKGNITDHSVSGFASFIDSNFYIISFDKRKLKDKIIYKIVKLFFK